VGTKKDVVFMLDMVNIWNQLTSSVTSVTCYGRVVVPRKHQEQE